MQNLPLPRLRIIQFLLDCMLQCLGLWRISISQKNSINTEVFFFQRDVERVINFIEKGDTLMNTIWYFWGIFPRGSKPFLPSQVLVYFVFLASQDTIEVMFVTY